MNWLSKNTHQFYFSIPVRPGEAAETAEMEAEAVERPESGCLSSTSLLTS